MHLEKNHLHPVYHWFSLFAYVHTLLPTPLLLDIESPKKQQQRNKFSKV